MNEVAYAALAFVAGISAGTLFFWGLWLTTQKAVASKLPALWFAVSFIVRVAVTLALFYYASTGQWHWQKLLLCLLGFITARTVIVRRIKATGTAATINNKEVGHEA